MPAGLILALAVAGAPPCPPRPGGFVHPERWGRAQAARAHCLDSPAAVAAQDLTPDPLAAATDVQHVALDIEVMPDAGCLAGSNVMTIRSLVDSLSAFRFRLDTRFNLDSVASGGRAQAWRRIDDATVEVTLDPPVASGATFDLAVAYDGCPAPWWPTGIYFDTRFAHPLVWTLSEPWYAETWWPSKDDNTDKVTADLYVTVPNTMTVAANGLLAATDDIAGGKRRYHWATAYPIAPYLISFSAGTYDAFSATFRYDGGSMPLEFFIFPDTDTQANRDLWLQTITMLGVFSDDFGPYPFISEKYGIYQFGFGGGMEHQTMTGQGADDSGAFDPYLSAHELAHQWWGDMVTCATWHDIWLNEGFATYAEALWAEGQPGSSGRAALLQAMSLARPATVDGSVYCYDTSDDNRVFSGDFSYRKGAWVLHMLRHVMGDAAFFQALAAYREAYAYSSATTAQFQAIAEGFYGGSLKWFFDPWVYGVGAPAWEWAWRQTTAGGRNYVELCLAQAQQHSYPTFTMPLDVRTHEAGADTVHVVVADARSQHALFATDGAVDSVDLDPEQWVLATYSAEVAFVEGPPRIVATDPAPGAHVPPGAPRPIRVVFHKDVSATASAFSLTGDAAGPVAFAYSYDAGSTTATLTPAAPLPPGRYTLTVSDSVTDTASGQALDGEVADPSDPRALPSGDGQPGGAAVVRFEVARPVRRHLARPWRRGAGTKPASRGGREKFP